MAASSAHRLVTIVTGCIPRAHARAASQLPIFSARGLMCGTAEAFDADLVVMHVVEGREPQLFGSVEAEFRKWVDPTP